MGTSGPYALAHAPVVENSERVELIVRDRAQPSLVRSSTSLQRFTDYELEPLTGRLLLRTPAPSDQSVAIAHSACTKASSVRARFTSSRRSAPATPSTWFAPVPT